MFCFTYTTKIKESRPNFSEVSTEAKFDIINPIISAYFSPVAPLPQIRRYTKKGGTVLYPFLSSGTTLYECESLQRNLIGFDINQSIPDFVESFIFKPTSITG
ncbi:MAG: DNA methyltransferase [Salegentibacter sp.]|uniref:DNA methyltransferase n=1 Tax=Salegentibacter sp. TaxID=1903072 RepID=UPI0028704E14|nr:DNA methyltransferase [Salegentibacter sp.]MDR9458361.1 DNA methyltransferase [Salegentibacter sp.]